MITTPDLLAVARGDRPADLLIRGGRVVNVFSGEIEDIDIAIVDNKIAGLGHDYRATAVLDAEGAYVVPGLIDAHVHIESSLCVPSQFATALLPRGVTCAITDPHEIANVAGLAGIRYMAESSRNLPLSILIMASSCVPATNMESSGAILNADDLALLLHEGVVYGLAEVMNYPGVIDGEVGVVAKITAFRGHPIDGHVPQVRGRRLNAYIAAGIGSDHECITVAEAAEKLGRGLYILIREATNAHNLQALLPLINSYNSRRICFCTDDRIPQDLLEIGSIDAMLRTAIAYGIDPLEALRMATLNTAECYQLHDRGAIAPGRMADMLLVDNLRDFHARQVIAGGRLVASHGKVLPTIEMPIISTNPDRKSINIAWNSVNLAIPARGRQIRVIGSLENQLITEARILDATIVDGNAVADPNRDLLKMAVIERHHACGTMGVGFIQGIGLQEGAIAGSVAHDHHNLVVIGADDQSMMCAAHAVDEMGGGLVVALGEQITAKLPLPIAGLMSDQPIQDVAAAYNRLRTAAAQQGSPLHDPFMAMSFMALEVIPQLKLTDKGLVDVTNFALVDLFV